MVVVVTSRSRTAGSRRLTALAAVPIAALALSAAATSCGTPGPRAPDSDETVHRVAPVPYRGPEPDRGLLDVDFPDPRNGWAVGETDRRGPNAEGDGVILKTTDGGVTWSEQTTDAWHPFFGVSFADELNGWVVGGKNGMGGYVRTRILATSDGGETWEVQDPGTSAARFWTVEAISPTQAWAVGEPNVVLATDDGGANWRERPEWRQAFVTTEGRLVELRDIGFADAQAGWLVGTGYPDGRREVPTVLRTVDGGATWSAQQAPPGQVRIGSVGVIDDRAAWVAGRGGAASTADGGAQWKRTRLPDGTIPRTLSFADRDRGWLVADRAQSGPLFETTDAGRTWHRGRLPLGTGLLAVAALDARTAVGVGRVIARIDAAGTRLVPSSASMGELLFEVAEVGPPKPFRGAVLKYPPGKTGVHVRVDVTNVGTDTVPRPTLVPTVRFGVRRFRASEGDQQVVFGTRSGTFWPAPGSKRRTTAMGAIEELGPGDRVDFTQTLEVPAGWHGAFLEFDHYQPGGKPAELWIYW